MLLAYKKRRERYAVAVTVTAWVGCVSYVVFLLLASLLYELHGEELPMPYLPFVTAGTLVLAIFASFCIFVVIGLKHGVNGASMKARHGSCESGRHVRLTWQPYLKSYRCRCCTKWLGRFASSEFLPF